MKSKSCAAVALPILFACCGATALADPGETDYAVELAKKIKSAQVVRTLGPDLVGDSTNLYSGATSFSVVDVSLPGNSGLSVAIGRKYAIEPDHYKAHQPNPGIIAMQRLFGDWDLDIPYLSGIYENQRGWQIFSATPDKRCSVLSQQGPSGGPAHGSPSPDPQWFADEYWHGIDLHLSGGGSQSLLMAINTTVARPDAGGPYHWTTKGDWWFSCLDSTSNGKPGEAFVGRSPSGEIYRFEHLSERRVTQLKERNCALDGIPEPQGEYDGECYTRRQPRKEVMLLPTEVKDRFGNWVKYHWTSDTFARLDKITSSDGRTITLHYEPATGRVDWVSDGSRKWTYLYKPDDPWRSLQTVVLPDNSKWEYALLGLPVEGTAISCVDIGEPHTCYAPPVVGWTGSGYIIHPSGARVDFTAELGFKPPLNGTGAGGGSYPLRLTSKKISGPGLADQTWTYSYWPDRGQFIEACGSNGTTCPTQIYVDAKGPDGVMTRSYFGIELNVSQGLLLSEQRGRLDGTNFEVLSTTTYQYADPWVNNGYVAKVGSSPLDLGTGLSEFFYSERRLPVRLRTTTQQGATFTTSTTAFDAFAQPAVVSRSSAGLAGPAAGYTRTETNAYHHATDPWVIGQPKSTISGGRTVSETSYNAKALPEVSKKFGAVQATYAYNADGTLASVTDGNGESTTLSSWHRGVPQTIGFPTVTDLGPSTHRATVDNLGNLTKTFDEFETPTTYGHDSMGRLASIAYAAETDPAQSWNPLVRSLTMVDCASIGIPANCWRQSVSAGNGKTTTWYDARFNPVLTLTEDTASSASKSYVVRRFDAFGHETFASYPVLSAQATSTPKGIVTEYDALGRPTAVKQDSELGTLTTTTEYLPGFQTRVTNPRGKATTTSYQVFDDPAAATPASIQAPGGVKTTIVRDPFGAPLSITRSGPGG